MSSDATVLIAKADTLQLAGEIERAMESYRQALSLDGTLFEAWYGIGCCLLRRASYGAAAEALSHALAARGDAAGARCNLAEALFQLGFVDDAVRHFLRVAKEGDAEVAAVALDILAAIAPGASILDNAGVLALRRAWVSRHGKTICPLAPNRVQTPARKLRLGYVSAFFGDRNWMKPVFAVINAHDRTRFEIHLLSDGDDPSEASGYRDHAEDRVWQTAGLSNEALAQHIAAAEIDVLIDLNSYSVPKRLPLFLYRPAPRQYAWFNAYASTGMDVFDGLVADAAALPQEEDAFYSERVYRIAGSYLAFTVPYAVPEIVPPPLLTAGILTFGCLASAYKLTDAVLDAWARILDAAPRARLFLKNARLDDASNRDVLLRRLADRGIASERLLLEGGAEHFRFLEAYGCVDIALDVFPYNGGTTTMEALWQGVPVLTFNGDRCASRTSRSLLLAAGLADWVAADADDYVAKALAWASAAETPTRLATLRATMRSRLAASPACDGVALCRQLEAIYGGEWPARP